MARYLWCFFALVCLIGCLGTEIGNPDSKDGVPGQAGSDGGGAGRGGAGGEDSGIGGEGGRPDGLEVVPGSPIDFGTVCPGGVGRAGLDLVNRHPSEIQVHFEPGSRLLLPDETRVPALATGRVALILETHEDEEPGRLEGSLLFSVEVDGGLEPYQPIPWFAEIQSAPVAKATLLCGDEAPCRGFVVSAGGGEPLGLPFSIANDGCEPLHLEGVEIEGPEGARPSWQGGDLPLTLQPGDHWEGVLLFDGQNGPAQGTVAPRLEGFTPSPVIWVVE